jgi:hypothetical protein
MLELGDGPATIGHPRCWRATMAMQNLVEGAGSCLYTDSALQQPRASYMKIVFEYRTRNCFIPVASSWEQIWCDQYLYWLACLLPGIDLVAKSMKHECRASITSRFRYEHEVCDARISETFIVELYRDTEPPSEN